MQIVILSGGLGTRLRPITEKIPKSMVLVNNKPFLQYQIEILKKNGITDIVLCVGYLHEKIREYFGTGRKYGVKLAYSTEKNKLLGTAGALKNASGFLDREFMVMYGDSYLDFNYRDFISCYGRIKEPVLMAVYRNSCRYDKSNVLLKNNLVVKYDKHPDEKLFFIDYGISIIKRSIVDDFPANCQVTLSDVFKTLSSGGDIHAFRVNRRFYEIGSVKGLKVFSEYVKKHSL